MSRPAGAAPLVVAAHGSHDPRYSAIVESLAAQVRDTRPDLDVRVGYLDHAEPDLSSVATPGCVVVPLLLSRGHHVRVDIPARAAGCEVTPPCGPDLALLPVLARRLREAGWSGNEPVVLAAAGSTDPDALADVRATSHALADQLGLPVVAGFVSAGEPRIEDLARPAAVATYLLAPGHFHSALLALDVPVVSEPLGDAPELAGIIVGRYEVRAGRPR